MRRRRVSPLFWPVVIAILLGTLGASDAWAQGFTGGLRGAVKDADGIVPGVQVTLTNEGTSISRTTVTNAVGEYTFVQVSPGTYSVRATLQGYKTFDRKGLTIATQEFITLDILLEVGAIEEEVVVKGAAPLVETSNASVGTDLSGELIKSLPSLTRNAFMMGIKAPTYSNTFDPRQSRMQDQLGTSLVSLGGGLRGTNNYLIDGVSILDMSNRPALLPTMEALESIKVQVHTYDAEMGRTGGGAFNVAAKSGTNVFHGSAFYQMRPEWGMANNFFNERLGIPKPSGQLFFKAYGGSVGGPIFKSRTFFWVATEGYRDKSAWNGQLMFPTDRERSGDFSQTFDRNGALVVIYDPLTTRPNPSGTGYIRDPFLGNIIPPDRINPVAKNILSYFPRAQVQTSSANGTYNYTAPGYIANKADSMTGKVEHKFTDKWSLTGAFVYSHTDEPYATYFEEHPELDPNSTVVKRRPRMLAVNNMLSLNSTTFMTLRAGGMRFPDTQVPESAGFDLASLGFPASYVAAATPSMFPRISVLGKGIVGTDPNTRSDIVIGGAGYSKGVMSSYSVNGTVLKLVGRHSMKAGLEFTQLGRSTASLGVTAGTFAFDPGWTQAVPGAAFNTTNGDSFASLLLGPPSATTSSSIPKNTPLAIVVHYYGGYAQDDWRIGSKLTLNYGLRYEWESGPREIKDRQVVAFDRTVVSPLAALTGLDLHGGLQYAGSAGFPTTPGDPNKKKFSPRVGFAWSVNNKTVIRGGYGLFWAPLTYSASAPGYNQTTFVYQADNLNPTATLSNPFPTGVLQPVGNQGGLLTSVGGPASFNNQDRQSGYLHQYSVDFQRQLPGDMAVAIGYVGTRGEQVGYGTININQLTPDVVAQWGAKLNDKVPNPFYGIAAAGAFSTSTTVARGQLLRPFPQFGNISQSNTTGARTRYSAVMVRLEKRAGWWSGTFHYTWSRLDSDQYTEDNWFSTVRQSAPLNSYDLAAEYSRSLQDIPHKVVLMPTVRLPFGEGRKWATRGLANALIGGWNVSMLATYESGSPINVVQSSDNTGSYSGTQRPNWTGVDPNTPGSTIDRLGNYINPLAYSLAPAFTFGTAPRTDDRIRCPFRTNYDLAISKDTAVLGRLKAEIRVEILNLTNTPHFIGIDSRLGLASFGQFTQQSGLMRVLQLMLRLKW